MESQNPQDRMPDLERQAAEHEPIAELGSPPPQAGFSPPAVGGQHPAHAGSKTRRTRRSIGIWGWLITIVFVGLGLYFLSFSARQFYGYQVGTPTTATGIECRGGVPGSDPGDVGFSPSMFTLSEGCTATWSVGGQTQTGPIVGIHHLGSTDVHVHDGTAFTAPLAGWFFAGHILGGLFLIVVLGLGHLWDVGRLWRWIKPDPKRPTDVGDLPPRGVRGPY